MDIRQTSEHAAWESRLSRMADAATSWKRLFQGAPPTAVTGSALAEDDLAFPGLNLSTLVGYSLASATEHLDFALTVMKETGTLYPTAYMTVLRTSLLAGSHAAWILTPDDGAMRQLRGLEFLADDLRTQLVMVRGAFAASAATQAAQNDLIEQMVERQRQLQPIAACLKPGLQVDKCRINNTSIIETVALAAHAEDLVRSGVNQIWRSASAAAHGSRGFATMRLKPNAIVEGPAGSNYSLLRGDLANDIGPAAASATLAVSYAFKIFEQRRVAAT